MRYAMIDLPSWPSLCPYIARLSPHVYAKSNLTGVRLILGDILLWASCTSSRDAAYAVPFSREIISDLGSPSVILPIS